MTHCKTLWGPQSHYSGRNYGQS